MNRRTQGAPECCRLWAVKRPVGAVHLGRHPHWTLPTPTAEAHRSQSVTKTPEHEFATSLSSVGVKVMWTSRCGLSRRLRKLKPIYQINSLLMSNGINEVLRELPG